jgi:hypothetical protein
MFPCGTENGMNDGHTPRHNALPGRAATPAARRAIGPALVLAAGALAGCGAHGTHPDALPPAPARHAPATASPTASRSASPAAAPHVVVYRVTGRGTAASIVYLTDGKSAKVTETDVSLPWSRRITLPRGAGEQAVSLVADFHEIGGVTHDDSITVDGSVLTRGAIAGTGTGHSDLSGSFAS